MPRLFVPAHDICNFILSIVPTLWVLSVQGPPQGIVTNVLANAIQFLLVANDVLVIIRLPNRHAGCPPCSVDGFFAEGLDLSEDGPNRTRRGAVGPARQLFPEGGTGEAPPRPYVDNLDDAVQVIGHDDERVQSYFRADPLPRIPFRMHDIPQRVPAH